ncbi:endonuclease [Occultella glacieicola]|uniref:Endonuclease n=1 Tax=Occultella glacieicola TaxID=2518684 RepID=A0ABY2DWR9_9MICO|nr:endonuclease/exonuclease/phosphatase family protein [Occultella glacieicola]TDE88309.1 endonuclease [Occultella glacieicola]
MTPLRILSFNIQRGLSVAGRPTGETTLAAAFDGVSADVVALQEVDRDQPRSGHLDQARVIATALGLEHVRYAAVLGGDVRLGKRASGSLGARTGPGYGLAILSRYPITAWFARRLPRVPVALPGWKSGRPIAWHDEPRGAMAAVLATPAGPVGLCNTHLSQAGPMAALQLTRVLRSVDSLPGAHLVCGDLNLNHGTVARVAPDYLAARADTFPADRPRRQIDHTLVRGARIVTAAATRPPISDHRALEVTVDLG